MEFQISVIQVDRQTKPTDKGSYQQLELAYKNLGSGKLESKKIMSFVKPESVFKTLNESKMGDVFTITSEKNEKTGYWDWKDAKQSAPGEGLSTKSVTVTPSAKSTYETPEERAKKQVFIVKQSSLSAAINLLSIGAKVPPSMDLIIQEAQKFTDWVLGETKVSLADMPNDFPDVQ